MAFDIGDYKEVSERLAELFAKHPDARLSGTYEIRDIAGKPYVIYRAECFRDDADISPGVGTAWEEIPGKTPYTRGSEIQNAETSAWGRAIVAIGASSTKKGIASADEVRSARARQNGPGNQESTTGDSRGSVHHPPSSVPGPTSKNQRDKLKARCIDLGTGMKQAISDEREKWKLPKVDDCDAKQLGLFAEMLTELEQRLEVPFEVPA